MVAILILLIMVPLAAVVALVLWPKYILIKLDKLVQQNQEDPAHMTKVTNAVLLTVANAAYALDMKRQQGAPVKAPKRPGADRVAELAQWRVPDHVSLSSILDFENALNSATDERPLQEVLERHPEILASFTWGHNGVYVIPQAMLGNQYVPDFLIAAETSLGLLWTLVELESPTASLTISDGQHSKQLRKAIKQVTDWREWLSDNSNYAQRNTRENGLGLPGIRSDAHAVIIISRAERSTVPDRLRMRELGERNIEIRTYDWLTRSYRRLFPAELLDYIPIAKEMRGALDISSPLINGSALTNLIIDQLRDGDAPS